MSSRIWVGSHTPTQRWRHPALLGHFSWQEKIRPRKSMPNTHRCGFACLGWHAENLDVWWGSFSGHFLALIYLAFSSKKIKNDPNMGSALLSGVGLLGFIFVENECPKSGWCFLGVQATRVQARWPSRLPCRTILLWHLTLLSRFRIWIGRCSSGSLQTLNQINLRATGRRVHMRLGWTGQNFGTTWGLKTKTV